jgi:predicted phosphoribosyltransferase
MTFANRTDAGAKLAQLLTQYAGRSDVMVLALPRGGVPVAFPIARALHAPLDVFIVRKLGVPGFEEMAMGAIASGGVRLVLRQIVDQYNVRPEQVKAVMQAELEELARREHLYRKDAPPPDLRGKTIILVDDGLATGASMRAAVQALRQYHPERVVVAVPVASAETCAAFRAEVDEVICALIPQRFQAVGLWYEDFAQTTDDEVRALLDEASRFNLPQ